VDKAQIPARHFRAQSRQIVDNSRRGPVSDPRLECGFNLYFIVPLDGRDIVQEEKIDDTLPGVAFRAVEKVPKVDNAVGPLAPQPGDGAVHETGFAVAVRKQAYELREGRIERRLIGWVRDGQFILNLRRQISC
jgi:hypothetical protein